MLLTHFVQDDNLPFDRLWGTFYKSRETANHRRRALARSNALRLCRQALSGHIPLNLNKNLIPRRNPG